jgi:hypothetical protein
MNSKTFALDLDLFIIKLENDLDDFYNESDSNDVSIDQPTYEKILKLIKNLKTCIKCKKDTPIPDMCKTSNQCRLCYNIYLKEYMRKRYKRSDKIPCDRKQPRVCKYCQTNKTPDQFYKDSRYVCKDCFRQKQKDVYIPARKAKKAKLAKLARHL